MLQSFNHTKLSERNNSTSSQPFFQPKLTINQPNDVYEQEADAMADKVMCMQAPLLSTQKGEETFFKPVISSVQRKCAHCEEEENKVQRKEDIAGTAITLSTENYINSLAGGRALDKSVRSFFEPRMGYDFSNVRLHTDTSANESAKNVNALAYTHDNNIVFASNQYQPESNAGKKLLAHELTHVIQQHPGVQRQEDADTANQIASDDIGIYNSITEGDASPEENLMQDNTNALQQQAAACPVTAVFSSTLAGTEKQSCRPPENTQGVSKLARFRLTGVPAQTSTTVTEQFKMLEDPYSLFSKLVPNTFTTSTGIFDDCYMIASKNALPPDFKLKVLQNHLVNGAEVSKNEITYAADGVRFCTHKRVANSCDFSARCSLG